MFGPQFTGRYIPQVVEGLATIWDDNELQNVDYFDFWSDPDRSFLDSARGVFHREWLTEEELFQALEWLRQLGEGTIYPVDWQKLRSAGDSLERGTDARLSSIGMTGSGKPEIYGKTDDPQDQKNKEYMILHYWEDNRHAIIVNKEQCVYDGPSPYWRHRKKPFIFTSYEAMPNEMYGMSAVQIISDLQEEENTQHNQRLDNVSMIINRGWIRRKGSDIPNSALVNYPRMILDVPDIHNDLKPIDMGNMPSAAYLEPDLIAQIMEMGISDVKAHLNNVAKQLSMDKPLGEDSDDGTLENVLQSEEADPPDDVLMQESLNREINRTLSVLNKREAEILKMFYGLNGYYAHSLEEIGEIYGLSREGVRQLKETCIRRLKQTTRHKNLKS